MKKQNHYNEYRQHMVDTFRLGRYVIPATVSTLHHVPGFFNMELETSRSAYFVQAISRALKKVPQCNSSFIRNRWINTSRIVYFDEVCCTFSIDKIVDGEHFPVGCVIKNADKLSVKEIYAQIQYVKETPFDEQPELVKFAKFLKLPRFVRKLIMREMICNEELFKKKLGTFNLSEIGMVQGITGGSLVSPRLVVETATKRDSQEVGISYNFNHAIIDGYHIAKLNREVVKIFKKADFF